MYTFRDWIIIHIKSVNSSYFISSTSSSIGLMLLLAGLLYKDEEDIDPQKIAEWEPDQSKMPESGRIMYRVDTTLIEPIKTSILCGKCASLYWVEGRKPKSFDCPECLVTLWHQDCLLYTSPSPRD